VVPASLQGSLGLRQWLDALVSAIAVLFELGCDSCG
jgi:hypothetical protein